LKPARRTLGVDQPAETFAEVARTLQAEHPVQATLDKIVEQAAQRVPCGTLRLLNDK